MARSGVDKPEMFGFDLVNFCLSLCPVRMVISFASQSLNRSIAISCFCVSKPLVSGRNGKIHDQIELKETSETYCPTVQPVNE